MPQMEFADYAPQLVWLAITFVIFYFLMARVALPRIADVLEQRQRRLSNDLEQAAGFRDEAEKALKAYQETIAEARAKAHAIAREAREQVGAEADSRRAEFEADLAARLAEEEARIAARVAEVESHLRDVAVTVAHAASLKLLGSGMTETASARAVEAEIARRSR